MRYWCTSGESFPLTRERSIGPGAVPVAVVFLPVVVLLNRGGWAVPGTCYQVLKAIRPVQYNDI